MTAGTGDREGRSFSPGDAAALAAEYWREREHVEVVAASLFSTLQEAMTGANAPRSLVGLAEEAVVDELDHADRCTALVRRLRGEEPGSLTAPTSPLPRTLRRLRLTPDSFGDASDTEGTAHPKTWSVRDMTLYTAVGVGCVTESLSTALLGTIQDQATHPLVAETAHHILRDEIRHARLGWAYLEHYAKGADPSWLAPHIPALIDAAIVEESTPDPMSQGRLVGFGVLAPAQVEHICQQTIDEVIMPGLRHFGVSVS